MIEQERDWERYKRRSKRGKCGGCVSENKHILSREATRKLISIATSL